MTGPLMGPREQLLKDLHAEFVEYAATYMSTSPEDPIDSRALGELAKIAVDMFGQRIAAAVAPAQHIIDRAAAEMAEIDAKGHKNG